MTGTDKHCSKCGHIIKPTDAGEICPECGQIGTFTLRAEAETCFSGGNANGQE
ncbi:MAG: hypothetical protein AAB906_00135 [Patescibacteria group bacterium]